MTFEWIMVRLLASFRTLCYAENEVWARVQTLGGASPFSFCDPVFVPDTLSETHVVSRV